MRERVPERQLVHDQFSTAIIGPSDENRHVVSPGPFWFTAECCCGRWSCRFDGEDAKKGPIVAFRAHSEHQLDVKRNWR